MTDISLRELNKDDVNCSLKRELELDQNDDIKQVNVKRSRIDRDSSSSTTPCNNTYSSLNDTTDDSDVLSSLECLSVEIMVKIFSYCDPFTTPLLYISRHWYHIIASNQLSIWRHLFITINENRPLSCKPLPYRILSYFCNGYGRGLHCFSLTTSLSSTKPINNNNNNNNTSSSNNNVNSNHIQPRTRQQQQQQSMSIAFDNCKSSFENINMVDFIRSLGQSLASCRNLRQLEISLPLDSDQLHSITSNCPNLSMLGINSILISDKEFERALEPLNHIENLSLLSLSHQANLVFMKQQGKTWTPKSTLSPMALCTISKLQHLKSLKFSLLPHYGHKILVENGIVSESAESNEQQTQSDLEQSIKTLINCKQLENLELMNCNIKESSLELLQNNLKLNSLILYRNSSLVLYSIGSLSTITHLSLSCLPMLRSIRIDSNVLEELFVEGCDSLQSTELATPALKTLSLEGCTGKIKMINGYNVRTFSLFECPDMTQKELERNLDSLINLDELYIYLHQIGHLRICSSTLRRLDIEAWPSINTCLLDCPSLEEFKANESSLETLYLKSEHVSSIELDFCDNLRNAIIDVVSCRQFSFTQNHPAPSTHYGIDPSAFKICDPSAREDDTKQERDGGDSSRYLSPTSLFLQAHHFIKDCTILSGNLLGKLSTRIVGQLSVEQKSFSTYVFDVDKICKLNTYHESRGDMSTGARSPRFIPIDLKSSSSTSSLYNPSSPLMSLPMPPLKAGISPSSSISSGSNSNNDSPNSSPSAHRSLSPLLDFAEMANLTTPVNSSPLPSSTTTTTTTPVSPPLSYNNRLSMRYSPKQ